MTFALWFLNRFGAFLVVPIAVLLLIFPTGRFLPGRWGAAGKVALASWCCRRWSCWWRRRRTGWRRHLPPGVDLDPTTIPVPREDAAGWCRRGGRRRRA